MHGVAKTLICLASLITAAGCSSRIDTSKGRPKGDDQVLADAADDERRSTHELNQPDWMTSGRDRYRAQVKLAGVHAKARPMMLPDPAEYGQIIATRPDDSGAKIAFARTLVSAADRAGHLFKEPALGRRGAAWMDEVIRKHPDEGENFLLHARCRQIAGDPVDHDLADAERLTPDDPAVRLMRARLLIAAKDYAGANEQLQAALVREPENPDAHYLSGVLSRLKGDAAGAKASEALALKYAEDHVDTLAASALEDFKAGDVSAFEAKARHIATIYPTHPVVAFDRALKASRAANHVDAIRDLQIAAVGDPENAIYKRLLENERAKAPAASSVP